MTPVQTPPAFELPAALRSQGYTLRPEADADIPFLQRLYASTREAELAPIPWTPEQKLAFVQHQFQAQRYHYRTYFPDCAFDIIESSEVPTGRLYLDARATRLHIIDIALVPERRGRGLGSAILDELIATARRCGKGVDLFVEKYNPALRLYRRLGFVEIADQGVYLEMEWTPQTPAVQSERAAAGA